MSGYYLNPLSAQELLLAQSIVIKNETTVEYIRMWFDSMLDVLCDTLEKDCYIVDLGSMIYDIAGKSKVKHGLFRYSNKETIIRYAVDQFKHTIKVDLYMFDDVLKVAPGCYNSAVRFEFGKGTTIGGIRHGLYKNPYFKRNVMKPNEQIGMTRKEVVDIVTGEIMDFIAIMLFSVIKRRTLPEQVHHESTSSESNRTTVHHRETLAKYDNIAIDETKRSPIYTNINRRRGPIDHQFSVKGHFRHYKSGRVIYIEPYIRCKDKPVK